MAFPFVFYSNFEDGTNSEWTSESDTGSLLDIVHYSEAARDENSLVPYRGAYVLRNKLGDTNDHTLTSTTIAIADAATSYFRWYMGLSRDFRFTADDTFNIFELQQSGGTVETSIGMRVTNSTQLIEIGIGDGTAPTSFAPWPIRGLPSAPIHGHWVCVEVLSTISTGAAGVTTLFLNGTQVATLTGQTNAAAIGKGVLGSQNTLSTTLGAIYFDDFIQDDSRLYPYRERYPMTVPVLKAGHVFVGPGYIDGAALYVIATGDESLILYDTDTATTSDASQVVELSSTVQTSVGGPLYFQRGCYAALSGTNPRATVYIMRSSEKPGIKGPLYYSKAGVRYWGNNRKTRPLNA